MDRLYSYEENQYIGFCMGIYTAGLQIMFAALLYVGIYISEDVRYRYLPNVCL